ncbi:uncharacterized protein LOC112494773 [Cephus cinctus]|uniref:Uncharacterized protein LOC112494773 n=1 Tax=Cephus cinctus TaxID=211228 RepID=A0AAJ7W431_CEPCN|nr:uncharacterized protein LOC112494773 [Cephus cinctus]
MVALRSGRKGNGMYTTSALQQGVKRLSGYNYGIMKKRRYDHPYATRSKTCTSLEFPVNKNKMKLHRESSGTSVIFLGYYRKIPELITLDDSTTGVKSDQVEE